MRVTTEVEGAMWLVLWLAGPQNLCWWTLNRLPGSLERIGPAEGK